MDDAHRPGPDDAGRDDDPAHADDAAVAIGGIHGSDRTWTYAIFGGGGAAVGALVPLLAGWAARVPWMPFQGPLELIGSFDQSWLSWGRPLLGLLLGLALGAVVVHRATVLLVSRERITVTRGNEVVREIARDQVDAVYPEKGHLVVETAAGRRLYDDEVEGDRGRHREVLLAAGYPWEGPRD